MLDETRAGQPPIDMSGGEEETLVALRRLSSQAGRGVTALELATALDVETGKVRAELGSLLRKNLVRCEGLLGHPAAACWHPAEAL